MKTGTHTSRGQVQWVSLALNGYVLFSFKHNQCICNVHVALLESCFDEIQIARQRVCHVGGTIWGYSECRPDSFSSCWYYLRISRSPYWEFVMLVVLFEDIQIAILRVCQLVVLLGCIQIAVVRVCHVGGTIRGYSDCRSESLSSLYIHIYCTRLVLMK